MSVADFTYDTSLNARRDRSISNAAEYSPDRRNTPASATLTTGRSGQWTYLRAIRIARSCRPTASSSRATDDSRNAGQEMPCTTSSGMSWMPIAARRQAATSPVSAAA